MKKTSKILALALALVMTLSLVSCTSGGSTATPTPTAAPTATPTAAPAEELKLGMAVVTGLSGSDASADGNGLAQADSVTAAVLLDAEGKIVSCKLDTAQNKMNFTAEGTIVDLDKTFLTKKELREDYGMLARSQIGKEWYEQAMALEAYVVGLTAEEVAGIAVSDTTVPTDADLLASVTIKIGDYQEAIAAACENATQLGSAAGDTLGLAINTTMSGSIDASADADGICFAYSNYSAVTVNGAGEITGIILDSTQSKISFDTTGVITTDLETATVSTKRELGFDYGMLARSEIGKEWFEQAQALCTYVTGMTADEVTGIAVSDTTVPTDADLLASVTMKIGDYQSVIAKAISYAN